MDDWHHQAVVDHAGIVDKDLPIMWDDEKESLRKPSFVIFASDILIP